MSFNKGDRVRIRNTLSMEESGLPTALLERMKQNIYTVVENNYGAISLDFSGYLFDSDWLVLVEGKGEMALRTTLVVTKVLRKSSSPAFKGIQVDDQLFLSCPLKKVGRNAHSTHAAVITIINGRTGETSFTTFNLVESLLDCVEVEEL